MHKRMNSFNRMQNNVALCELLKGNSGSFKPGLYVYIFGCINAILTKGIGTGPLKFTVQVTASEGDYFHLSQTETGTLSV